MSARRMEQLAWILTCAMIVVVWLGFRHRSTIDAAEAGPPATRPHLDLQVPDTASFRESAGRIVARDPFRLDRRPAEVRFDPDPPPPSPPAPSRPSIAPPVLRGVLGPPWRAVLEGVPGHDRPVVARVGSVFGEMVIARIGEDTVIVEMPDTSFTLTVRRTWR